MKTRFLAWFTFLIVGVLVAIPAPVKAARLLHMDAKNRIPGAYKVIFKQKEEQNHMAASDLAGLRVAPNKRPESPLETEQLASALASAGNGKMTHLFYGDGSTGFAVEALPDDKIPDAYLTDPRIDYIEPALWLTLRGSPQTSAPWYLDRIDQRNLPGDGSYSYTTTAPDVDVYVFDTGITVFHQEFATCPPQQSLYCTRVRLGTNAGSTSGVTTCLNSASRGCSSYNIGYVPTFDMGYPDSGDPCQGTPLAGHGTAMASLIGGNTFGVAKQVRLYAYRVVNCQGKIDDRDLVVALQNALSNLPRQFPSGALASPTVFNLSLGANSIDTTLDNNVKDAINKGVVVVVAAGNGNADACTGSPADVSTAIVVGASQANDKAWWSTTFDGTNYGRCVSLFAPGDAILSAWNGSLTDTTANHFSPLPSGTSASAAFVSGIAALYLESHFGASPASVKAAIIQSATGGKLSGASFGPGSPNLLAYSLTPAGNQPPPPPGKTMSGVTAAIISAIYSLLN
jgi:hypothetical protein